MNTATIKVAQSLVALGPDAEAAITLYEAFRTSSAPVPAKAGNGKAKAAHKAKAAKPAAAAKAPVDRSEAMKRAWETRKAKKQAAADAVLSADAASAAAETDANLDAKFPKEDFKDAKEEYAGVRG